MRFSNRSAAGKELAKLLAKSSGKGVVVYALPRGGVIVGTEIAKALHNPMDLIITRKIGLPEQPELAIAAVAEDGHLVVDPDYEGLVETNWFAKSQEDAAAEAKRRRETYLKDKETIKCKGRTAVLVDDGVATGLTLKSAINELKLHYHPKKIIVAVPIIPLTLAREFESEGIQVIAIEKPIIFSGSVGAYYENFSPVEDKEVIKLCDLYRSEITGVPNLLKQGLLN